MDTVDVQSFFRLVHHDRIRERVALASLCVQHIFLQVSLSAENGLNDNFNNSDCDRYHGNAYVYALRRMAVFNVSFLPYHSPPQTSRNELICAVT